MSIPQGGSQENIGNYNFDLRNIEKTKFSDISSKKEIGYKVKGTIGGKPVTVVLITSKNLSKAQISAKMRSEIVRTLDGVKGKLDEYELSKLQEITSGGKDHKFKIVFDGNKTASKEEKPTTVANTILGQKTAPLKSAQNLQSMINYLEDNFQLKGYSKLTEDNIGSIRNELKKHGIDESNFENHYKKSNFNIRSMADLRDMVKVLKDKLSNLERIPHAVSDEEPLRDAFKELSKGGTSFLDRETLSTTQEKAQTFFQKDTIRTGTQAQNNSKGIQLEGVKLNQPEKTNPPLSTALAELKNSLATASTEKVEEQLTLLTNTLNSDKEKLQTEENPIKKSLVINHIKLLENGIMICSQELQKREMEQEFKITDAQQIKEKDPNMDNLIATLGSPKDTEEQINEFLQNVSEEEVKPAPDQMPAQSKESEALSDEVADDLDNLLSQMVNQGKSIVTEQSTDNEIENLDSLLETFGKNESVTESQNKEENIVKNKDLRALKKYQELESCVNFLKTFSFESKDASKIPKNEVEQIIKELENKNINPLDYSTTFKKGNVRPINLKTVVSKMAKEMETLEKNTFVKVNKSATFGFPELDETDEMEMEGDELRKDEFQNLGTSYPEHTMDQEKVQTMFIKEPTQSSVTKQKEQSTNSNELDDLLKEFE